LYAAADGKERRKAFVLAALNGKAESLRRMIALGAGVNTPSENLYAHGTPLHHAVCSGSLEAVQVLVDAGAGVNTRDTAWKGTPLGWANHYIEEAQDAVRRGRYQTIADYLSGHGGRDD
jgi:ankyrin repeat protein